MTVSLLTLKGTHGTCVSFASDIRRRGFDVGAGRRGSGMYFWSYSNTARDYATCLAKAWWKYAFEIGRYQSASDSGCEVLNVIIEVEEENFLDLEEHAMKQKLVPFLNDIYKRTASSSHKKIAVKAYDLFVEQIEKQRSNPIKVVHVTVSPPSQKYFTEECTRSLSSEACMPACYVVKDNKCIVVR